jgi:hypothetical protein
MNNESNGVVVKVIQTKDEERLVSPATRNE